MEGMGTEGSRGREQQQQRAPYEGMYVYARGDSAVMEGDREGRRGRRRTLPGTGKGICASRGRPTMPPLLRTRATSPRPPPRTPRRLILIDSRGARVWRTAHAPHAAPALSPVPLPPPAAADVTTRPAGRQRFDGLILEAAGAGNRVRYLL